MAVPPPAFMGDFITKKQIGIVDILSALIEILYIYIQ